MALYGIAVVLLVQLLLECWGFTTLQRLYDRLFMVLRDALMCAGLLLVGQIATVVTQHDGMEMLVSLPSYLTLLVMSFLTVSTAESVQANTGFNVELLFRRFAWMRLLRRKRPTDTPE
jgi:hypothetical protein